jgi:hypothetical protein
MAETLVVGPLCVSGLAHEHGLHPVSEALGPFHDGRIERTVFLRELVEAFAELHGKRV